MCGITLNCFDQVRDQVIAALHKDTDNIHLHVAINKVHPVTCKVVKPANGWDIEAAHRTVAIVEHRQGWQREPNGRYVVLEDGTVARVGKLDSAPSVPSRAADMENRTGQKSAARIGIEEAGELIRAAASWAELHQGLAERGMRYVKAGGVGAHIYVGDQAVKASTAGHWCSLPKLTKRLGAFEPAGPAVVVVERKPEPLRPDLPGWDDYISAGKHHREQLAKKQREEKERFERELAQFRAEKAQRSAALAAQNWKGKGEMLNAMRSVTAAEAKKVELEIRERHRREAKALRDARDAWPEYHDWLAKWFSPEDAGDYRYHRHEPLRLEGDGDNEALPRDLRAFTGEVIGGAVEYRRQGAAGGVSEEVSFTDHGRRIDVQEAHDEAATLAALQLGAAKWGKVSVYGFGYHIPLYALGDSIDFFGAYSDVNSGTISAGIFRRAKAAAGFCWNSCKKSATSPRDTDFNGTHLTLRNNNKRKGSQPCSNNRKYVRRDLFCSPPP